jgi:hypothetical protein
MRSKLLDEIGNSYRYSMTRFSVVVPLFPHPLGHQGPS